MLPRLPSKFSYQLRRPHSGSFLLLFSSQTGWDHLRESKKRLAPGYWRLHGYKATWAISLVSWWLHKEVSIWLPDLKVDRVNSIYKCQPRFGTRCLHPKIPETQICISRLITISGNRLSPVGCQAVKWANTALYYRTVLWDDLRALGRYVLLLKALPHLLLATHW